jgi:transposase
MISAYSKSLPQIPKETVRAANAVFGRSNFYILVGEHLEGILEDVEWKCFLGAENPSKLEGILPPLITFFQFVEALTDIQSIDAVRTRTDWKFALHLSLLPATLHEEALCQFRQRILAGPGGQREYQRLIGRLVAFVPTLTGTFPNLSSLQVISTVCTLNRLHLAQQAVSEALEVLAVRHPEWLRKIALPHWYGRYNPTIPRLEVALLLGQQRFLMEEIASDIHQLLEKVHQSGSPELRQLQEVQVLERIWLQQFQALDQADTGQLEALSLKDCHLCFHSGVGRRHHTQV